MSLMKKITSVAATAAMLGVAALAMAAPASANDEGTVLGDGIYWFSTQGGTPLAGQPAGAQLTSGHTTDRPWRTLTTNLPCPTGTASLQPYIRIPQSGSENDWAEVSMGGAISSVDDEGRFYTGTDDGPGDWMTKDEILRYLTAHSGAGDFPFIAVCLSATGNPLGNFRTMVHMTGTTQADLAWSKPEIPIVPQGIATTTTLAASATTVESGSPVTLTATVEPAAAAGDVQFLAGTTPLGVGTIAAGVATLTTTAIPVGTNAVTAVYPGGTGYNASTSAPVSIEVTAVAQRTTTTLAVAPVTGPAYADVAFTTTVTSATGAPNGTVTFRDGGTVLGSVPVTGGVVPAFSTNVLGAGAHSLTAEFVGTAPYTNSTSPVVDATYALTGVSDEQTVTVDIPVGAISMTTPYTPAAPLSLGTAVLDAADSTYSASAPFNDIVITDTRLGRLGFSASVVSGAFQGAAGGSFGGEYAGLTGLAATQVAGNALLSGNVTLIDHVPFADGLGTPKVFAQYAAGQALGTAHIAGTFGIDQVPTSVVPGLYTATVTFTAV